MSSKTNTAHRVFQLISLMSETPRQTREQLAVGLGCTVRFIYRYRQVLEEVGYSIFADSS